MPMFSIIVPVYKVEEYLPACIESVLAQTCGDFELILVDDGSPDRSGAICDEYAARDGRVRVIHKRNGGPSAARNTGIANAKGEYITFVDSDDLIDRELLTAFRRGFAAGPDVDIAMTTKYRSFTRTPPEQLRNADEIRPRVLPGAEAARDMFYVNGRWEAFGTAYRAAFSERFRFPEDLGYGEDYAAMATLFLKAKRVAVIDLALYYYRGRDGSIMASSRTKGIPNDLNRAVEIIIRAIRDSGFTADEQDDLIAGALMEPASRIDYACSYHKQNQSGEFIRNGKRLIRKHTGSILRSALPQKKKRYLVLIGFGLLPLAKKLHRTKQKPASR